MNRCFPWVNLYDLIEECLWLLNKIDIPLKNMMVMILRLFLWSVCVYGSKNLWCFNLVWKGSRGVQAQEYKKYGFLLRARAPIAKLWKWTDLDLMPCYKTYCGWLRNPAGRKTIGMKHCKEWDFMRELDKPSAKWWILKPSTVARVVFNTPSHTRNPNGRNG